jgi:hypothetical protein
MTWFFGFVPRQKHLRSKDKSTIERMILREIIRHQIHQDDASIFVKKANFETF